MNNMQQRVYRPPNVAGWEGGMSWLNTNTVQGRFDLVTRAAVPAVLELLPAATAASRRQLRQGHRLPPTRSATTAAAWVDKRADAVDAPWISARDEAGDRGLRRPRRSPGRSPRRCGGQRLYALQALMLGGPDGQVM